MRITRRAALGAGLLGGLAACEAVPAIGRGARTAAFPQGVASGDPQDGSVVLWTRALADGAVGGVAELSETLGFERIARRYRFETGPSRDHTVKVVADGLQPGRTYHYRFRVGDTVSPAGVTRCLPERAERARFAVASCSNYPFGHFTSYDAIARGGFDAVIHLGDYIYEYGPDGYGAAVGERLGRTHEPAREITTLDDYRTRHRQYKSDPMSQAMHASAPIIPVWDDHETTNNSWEGGAQNHDEGEGDWQDRKRAALQAYYEYMPVREPAAGPEAFWREFRWGGLLTLAAIETRLKARSEQFEYGEVLPELTSPEAVERWRREKLEASGREMMGAEQSAYVEAALRGSASRGEPWRLVANQVIMARVTAPNLAEAMSEREIALIEEEWADVRAFVEFTRLGLPLNVDAWDGYPAARQRFYDQAKAAGARDLVVLTGDTHEFWANRLADDGGGAMGVEIGTTGVTSPGPSGYLREKARDYSAMLQAQNPEIVWHGTGENGYVALTLEGDEGRADYVAVSTVLEPEYRTSVAKSFRLRKADGTVAFAEA
jgi:phosphodiesterase/alkaline phosphatase D-like protein